MALSGLLIDTNLLVLLVVGRTQRSMINRHRRLKGYSESDYDALVGLLDQETKIIVTPNTLTESSNLLAYGPPSVNSRLFETLKFMIHASEEIVVQSEVASEVPEFGWLGLTDAVLVHVASPDVPLITSDFRLWSAVVSRDPRAAINFNNLRL